MFFYLPAANRKTKTSDIEHAELPLKREAFDPWKKNKFIVSHIKKL
jgi:hypothetical protein